MTVEIRIYGEQTWADDRTNWRGALAKVQNQIRLALREASKVNPELEDADVKFVEDVTPGPAPDPDHLYAPWNNLGWWDEWLDEHDEYGYAEDANMLIMPARGGVTWGSNLNPNTTTNGALSLVGGNNLTASEGMARTGRELHHQNIYVALHELSHQLKGDTYWAAYGKYYEDDKGYWHRTPTNTQNNGQWSTYDVRDDVETPEEFEDCEHQWYLPEYHGHTYWDLTYTDCAARRLHDKEV